MIWARVGGVVVVGGRKRTWVQVVPHSVVHHTEVSMWFGFEVHTCCPLWLPHGSSNHTCGMWLRQRKSKAWKWSLWFFCLLLRRSWTEDRRAEIPTWLHRLGRPAGLFSSCPFVKAWKDSGEVVNLAFSTGAVRTGLNGWSMWSEVTQDMWKWEIEVRTFFTCRLVRLQDIQALAGSWGHICGRFVSCTCKDHILFVSFISWKMCVIKIEGQLKTFSFYSQPPCLSQSGEHPVSSVYSVLCSVSRRTSRNLENHPGRPLTILPRSSRAPALAPWFVVTAWIWRKKAAEAILAEEVCTITVKRCSGQIQGTRLPSCGQSA